MTIQKLICKFASKATLARELGVSRAIISLWQAGLRRPSLPMAQKLATITKTKLTSKNENGTPVWEFERERN